MFGSEGCNTNNCNDFLRGGLANNTPKVTLFLISSNSGWKAPKTSYIPTFAKTLARSMKGYISAALWLPSSVIMTLSAWGV